MKKLLCLLLALLMIVSVALVACGDKNDDDEINYNDDDLAFNPTQTTEVVTEATTTKAAETTAPAPVSTNFTEVNEKVYVQNCVQANLRSTPSAASNSNIKAAVEFGSSYTRVKYNELWSGIEVDGEIFYINTYFLTTKPDEVVFTEMTKTLYVTNIDPNNGELGNLKLRTFTSTNLDLDFYSSQDDNVGAIAKHGAKLDVTGISSDGHWYRVNFTSTDNNGKTTTVKNLYVWNGKYVTETNPVVEEETTAAVTTAAPETTAPETTAAPETTTAA